MPVKRLTLKQQREKNKESLSAIYDEYVKSKRLLQSLRKKKTATINFAGSYDELLDFFEIKKTEIAAIDKELKPAYKNMKNLFYKYQILKHKVQLQTKIDIMNDEIKEMKKEQCVIIKANKLSAISFDLNKLNGLPLELVDIIESYIPYEVRNTLIEERKPFKLFKNMTPSTIKSFLMNICFTSEYLSFLSEEEKQKYIYNPEDHLSWNPEWTAYNKKKHIETRIKYIFHLFKNSCPKGAYKLMRMLLVLINPDKKYNKHDGNWFRITSIPV